MNYNIFIDFLEKNSLIYARRENAVHNVYLLNSKQSIAFLELLKANNQISYGFDGFIMGNDYSPDGKLGRQIEQNYSRDFSREPHKGISNAEMYQFAKEYFETHNIQNVLYEISFDRSILEK